MRHHRTAASAWLVSALALLALVGFPALAQSAVAPEYTDAPPSATGNNNGGGTSGGSSAETPAKKSSTPGGGGGGSAPSETGSGSVSNTSGNNSSSNSGGAANAGGGGDSGQQGSPATPTAEGNLGDAQNLGQSGSPAQSESDDGGSSPLVPILIAIFVLAAISLAVVLIRQRRQRGTPGEPASSKAG
jgi:hypothetical protein